MTARAMWKAVLVVGEESLPVKLYAAAADRGVHFRLVHAEDSVPVRRRLVHPGTGEEVALEDARRGVQLEPGLFVALEPEELAQLEPEPSRAIRVDAFVPAAALDERWYERPYYLGPDGDPARYAALAAAAEENHAHVGIAAWTMRGHAYRGALLAEGGHLALVTLRAREEVLPEEDLAAPRGEALPEGELKLAGRLIEAMASDFDWAAFRDEHPERVAELVRAKQAGKARKRPRFKPHVVRDEGLVEALKQSIRKAAS